MPPDIIGWQLPRLKAESGAHARYFLFNDAPGNEERIARLEKLGGVRLPSTRLVILPEIVRAA